jgi:ferredoxin, 2Fe-2S
MLDLIITLRDGSEISVAVPPSLTLMEAIRDHGGEELAAICGGGCSCATCHVRVAAAFLALLPPLSGDEDALLDGSDHRAANSRLACQIPLDAALNGLRVAIAPED